MSVVGQEKSTPTFSPSEPIPILCFSFSDPSCLIPSPKKRQKPGSEQRRNKEESRVQTHFCGPRVPPGGTRLSGNCRKPHPASHFPLLCLFPRPRRGLGKGGDPRFQKNSLVSLGKARGKGLHFLPACRPGSESALTSSEAPGLCNSRTWGFQSFASERPLESTRSAVSPEGVGRGMRPEA